MYWSRSIKEHKKTANVLSYSSPLSICPCLFYLLQNTHEAPLFVPDRLFKVVLVGNSSVGKTSLLRSFCEGRFHPSTTATVGEKRSIVMILFMGGGVTSDLHHMKGLVESHCLAHIVLQIMSLVINLSSCFNFSQILPRALLSSLCPPKTPLLPFFSGMRNSKYPDSPDPLVAIFVFFALSKNNTN